MEVYLFYLLFGILFWVIGSIPSGYLIVRLIDYWLVRLVVCLVVCVLLCLCDYMLVCLLVWLCICLMVCLFDCLLAGASSQLNKLSFVCLE